jgi:hypothetical protein
LFLSKKTARHMRWHKEGVRENDQVMVHPSDSEAWKALDDFDANFIRGARNAHIGFTTDGFSSYNTEYGIVLLLACLSYSVQPSIFSLHEI